MYDYYRERNNSADTSIFYQIDIILYNSSFFETNIDLLTEAICKYCTLPEDYSEYDVKARLLLSYAQKKTIVVDFKDTFEVAEKFFNELVSYFPMFMYDNFFKRKEATFII